MKPTPQQVILTAALALLASSAAASSSLGGAFTSDGLGARPLGMAGAFAAVADDANAAATNPAGMAFFADNSRFATFTHSLLFQVDGLYRDYVAYAQADDAGYGALGFSWSRFTANLDPESYTEDAFEYSGAKRLSQGSSGVQYAVGWNLKYFRINSGLTDSGASNSQTVGDANATGYGADLGLMIKPSNSLGIAVVVQDLYSTLSWDSRTLEVIPTVGIGGLSYRFTQYTTFAGEFRMVQGSSGFTPQSLHGGAEMLMFDGKKLQWGFAKNVALRMGYQEAIANNDGGQVDGGLSVKADSWQIDYAYQYMLAVNGLGNTQRMGLTFTF